jgi:hypothetical protein
MPGRIVYRSTSREAICKYGVAQSEQGEKPLTITASQLQLIPTPTRLTIPQMAAEKRSLSGCNMTANEQVWTPGQK